MIQPAPCLARSVRLAAILALLASPAALAQEMPDNHPPSTTTRADEAKSPDSKSADSGKSEAKSDASQLPPASITHHTIKVGGVPLDYTAEAGTLALPGSGGKTAANIFYVAYTRDPKNTKRPLTFVFNGGPGAAATYLHLGGIGPRVVEVNAKGELQGPPPALADNPSTWLDMTDLVFVDPVGTGYSRASEAKDEEKFWGVEQDTDALADFVRLYLIKSARMLSPVFLMGESYGGFRAASLARALQKSGTNSPSGVVLISPVLEFSLLYGEDYDPLSWALGLPSLAAVNLEKKGITTRDALASGVKEAETYALSDYLVELASGAEAGGKAASGTVARLTGLPLDVVERRQARISPSLFIKEFDRANSQVLSRYDGSVSGPDPNPTSSWARAALTRCSTPRCRYGPRPSCNMRSSELDYKTDETYRLLNRDARNKWDFGTSPTRQGYAGVIDEVQEARSANPALEVLIAGGYTDLITPYLASSFLVRPVAVASPRGAHPGEDLCRRPHALSPSRFARGAEAGRKGHV